MSEALCLVVTYAAAEKLLDLIDSSYKNAGLRNSEAQKRALELLRQVIRPGNHYQCIIKKVRGSSYFEISIIEAQLVLGGVVEDTPDEFVVTYARQMNSADGDVPWSKTVTLKLYDQGTYSRMAVASQVDNQFWDEINSLQANYNVIIKDRLEDWEHYLRILERIAEQKQFSFTYSKFRLNFDLPIIDFTIARGEDVSWKQIRAADKDTIHLEANEKRCLFCNIFKFDLRRFTGQKHLS